MPVTQNIAPVTINFTDTSSGDSLSYLWHFGDGGTSTQANPTHTFLAGVWEVTLTVTNSNGTDTSSTVIVALPSGANDTMNMGGSGKGGNGKGGNCKGGNGEGGNGKGGDGKGGFGKGGGNDNFDLYKN